MYFGIKISQMNLVIRIANNLYNNVAAIEKFYLIAWSVLLTVMYITSFGKFSKTLEIELFHTEYCPSLMHISRVGVIS